MSVNSISPGALRSVLPTESAFVSNISAESIDPVRPASVRPELSLQHDRSATEVARGSGVARTPGDAILSSMEKLSTSFTQAIEATSANMKPGEIHSADWLSAQVTISALSLQCDMLAKVVGKATQSLETFLKNQ
ncbi:type III secretion system inner rod subunit SctI [Mesorhizobium sp. M0496]|uniref:type III secretion system inner rod subunit SctI n=1 Tax=Mesorhizobium sp. M0496 TaxID=2956952 RepID=UPI00333C3DBC